MFVNPFTPIFGGRPEHFFGRGDVLTRFDAALVDQGSEDRVLFVTGPRGYGKTALIEQLSRRAARTGRRTIDLGADDTVGLLMRGLQTHDEESHSLDPQVSISVLGSGGSVGGVSSTKTVHYGRADLPLMLQRACNEAKRGLFISIDEVQKMAQDDLSAIGGAFQMASRKGCDVMLAMAGLPYAHDKVIHYEGCTYMRRAAHEELGLFSWEEARTAFAETLALCDGLSARDEALDELTQASYGHPYVIQLLGYHTIALLNLRGQKGPYELMAQDVQDALPQAIETYARRALRPLVDECSPQEKALLKGMADVLDGERVAHVQELADALGKTQQQISAGREALIKRGVIVAVGRGQLMFNVPYLAHFMQRGLGTDRNIERLRAWRV